MSLNVIDDFDKAIEELKLVRYKLIVQRIRRELQREKKLGKALACMLHEWKSIDGQVVEGKMVIVVEPKKKES